MVILPVKALINFITFQQHVAVLANSVVLSVFTVHQHWRLNLGLDPNFALSVDKDNCEFTYMQPKYYKLLGFDRARTQFAGKYGLLLFRDRYDYEVPVPPRLLKEYANNVYTIDKEARVRPLGIPALFIPGNAGSAKQVRSIAKEASRYYYETYLPERLRIGSTMSRPIDFFTVDFNEEFSALHGHSLLEQAQFLNDAIAYILSLYEDNNSRSLDSTLPKPTSVLILGHSMGGVVARSLFTMSNYKPGSVNTIVTAATPHMVPPVTLDFEISNIYNTIENFWTRGFLEGSDGSAASLANVSLVSIAGGNLDIVVNGDSGNIHNLVPQKNGFSVFTSSFPHAWVGADHVSILWCNQIATVIGKTLIDIVDASYAEQVKPLEERMKIFRNRFLTGVEDHIEKATYLPDTEIIDLSMVDHTIVDSRHPLVYPPKSSATHDVESTNPHFYVIPIPQTLDVDTFNLVTDYPLDIGTRLEVLRCKGQSFNDYSSTGSAPSTLTCKHGAFAAVPIPASPAQLASALGTRSNRAQEFRFISQKLDVINKDTDYIVLQDHGRKLAETGFVIAEFGAEKNSTLVTPTTTLGLLSNGFRLHAFPERPSLVSTLRFPNIDNSLLTYTLTVERQGCRTPQKFAPMMRRSSWLMYEDRYTSNIADRGSVDINFHGDVPYYERIQLPGKKGIELRFWMDPTCPVQLSLSMQVDRYGSMGKVMIRYRMVVLVFTYLVVVLTLRAQFRAWNRGEPFKPFGNMISQLITSTFWKFSLLLAAIAFLQSLQSRALVSLDAQGAVMMSSNAGSGVRNSNAEDEVRYGPGGRAAPYSFPGSREGLGQDAYERMVRARIARSESWFSSFRFSDALLGTNDTFFWFLAPVFFQISIGIVILIWLTLSGLVRSVAALLTFVSKRGGRYVIGQAIGNMLSKRSRGVRRRVITTIVLFIMVATFVPYQFAFVVAVLVHIVSCVRSLLTAQSASATSRAQASWDRYHYLMSIFVMFFLLLPCTLPVLMVWIRNLSVQWYEPFSSDHRLDYIAPFIFFVEAITDGAMIPRTPEKGYAAITIGILNYIIFFLILFGVRYSWQIFFMSRLWIVWLLILQLKDTEMVMGIAKTIEHLYGQAFAGPGKKQK
ncbi:GPI inositol deacylase [Gryganskiella cystojenkinii]|nr:GPI inositol deacylase [Gryganskiella cystojenkinii]